MKLRIQRRYRCVKCRRTGWGDLLSLPDGWGKVHRLISKLDGRILSHLPFIVCRPCIKWYGYTSEELSP